MNFFRIDALSTFTGEVVQKKHSRDFWIKETYAWICPKTLTLHWSKFSSIDKEVPTKSKYLRLQEQKVYPDAKLGTLVDTIVSAKMTATGVTVYLKRTKKDTIEFKMRKESAINWYNVLIALGVPDHCD